MPVVKLALTDLFIKKLKNDSEQKKFSDGQGLYIYLRESGKKLWQMSYRFEGKQKTLSFGEYPAISLAEAREKRSQIKKLIAQGIDPAEQKRQQKLEKQYEDRNTFEIVYSEWYEKFYTTRHPGTQQRFKSYFTHYVLPYIGNKPVKLITPKDMLIIMERMQNKGILESAHRVLSYCGQVFRYAVITERAHQDPTVFLKGALPPAKKSIYLPLRIKIKALDYHFLFLM